MEPTTKQEFSFPIDHSIFYGKYFRKMTIKCMFTRICIKSRINNSARSISVPLLCMTDLEIILD
jgi:hypothetical protein